jgi:protein-histidine pros-kinase
MGGTASPPLDVPPAPRADTGPPRGMPLGGRPSGSLWIDLAVRVLVIGLAAAWAARWLSAPVRDLGGAARRLREALQPASGRMLAQAPPQVDERRGSAEIRATAQVFNDMARQLKADFDAQRLLLATVSHDLRTPLSRLRLRLAGLEAAPAGALADIEQMNELLEGLLDLFRQPVSGAKPAALRVDVPSLVQALVDDLPSGSPAVHFDEAGPAVAACGALALRRILQNLLGNALRHSDDVAVSVRTESASTGMPQVVIRIDDRGPGLTPEQLAQAGTPFVSWQAASSSRPAADDDATRRAGLGLGLHIARALAEREGGEVRLSSREGGGLRAEVRVPAAS